MGGGGGGGIARASLSRGGARSSAAALTEEHVGGKLVGEAVESAGLIPLLINLLAGKAEGATSMDAADLQAAKVHAVEIIKLLERDGVYGVAASAQANDAGNERTWKQFRDQRHDLFFSRSETARQDSFLLGNIENSMRLEDGEVGGDGGSSAGAGAGAAAGGAGGLGAGGEQGRPPAKSAAQERAEARANTLASNEPPPIEESAAGEID